MSKDEFMDEELAGMVSYTDETVPEEMPVMERKIAPKAAEKGAAQDAEYTPVPGTARGTMEKLRTCATWLGVCGGIAMLMWWFEVNGLMAMEAAYPCILASAVIGAAGTGWSAK